MPTSEGFPAYPMGILAIMLSHAAPPFTSLSLTVMSVSIKPGQITLQVIPLRAFSRAHVLERPTMPALEAA